MHAAKKTAEDRPEASPAKLARVNTPSQMGFASLRNPVWASL